MNESFVLKMKDGQEITSVKFIEGNATLFLSRDSMTYDPATVSKQTRNTLAPLIEFSKSGSVIYVVLSPTRLVVKGQCWGMEAELKFNLSFVCLSVALRRVREILG